MNILLRHILLVTAMVASLSVAAQSSQPTMHKVKKHETIYGIAKDYGITVDQLTDANPEMKLEGYELKKGIFLFIPANRSKQTSTTKSDAKHKENAPVQGTATKTISLKWSNVKNRAIKVGVLLPLHNNDGDGKRMTEYYRGLLMACDSLKHDGISTDIHTWNLPVGASISQLFSNADLISCDVIFGPLYSSQMDDLSRFAKAHDIKLVVPFSITSSEVFSNRNVYQIYQPDNNFNADVIDKFMSRFAGHHPVFIDCGDSTSLKNEFTAELRRQLDVHGIKYNLTSVKTPEDAFQKAFARNQPNIVVLNSSVMPYMSTAIAKLRAFSKATPGVVMSLFGYPEWVAVTYKHLEDFYALDTYIPTTFYRDPKSPRVGNIEREYRRWFGVDMMPTYPRYALTGFDHAYYFIKGIHLYGEPFTGAAGSVGYSHYQTPLRFEHISGGGFQNNALILVHYGYDRNIEVINY